MSIKDWLGGVITDVPVVPAGPYQDGAASGVWTLDQAADYNRQGIWPIAGNVLPPFNLGVIYDSNSVGSEAVSTGAQSTYFDSSNNIMFSGTSSSTAIFSYNGGAMLQIASDLSAIDSQRNLDGTDSNDYLYCMYDTGSSSLATGYGFYYANNPDANSMWLMFINPTDFTVEAKFPWTYTSYYTSSGNTFIGVNGSNTYILFADYNSGSTSGWNIRLATLSSLTSSTVTFTAGKYFGGSNNAGASITNAVMHSTGIYICGQSGEMGQAQDVGFIAKMSYAGSMTWIKSYGTTSQNNYGTGLVTLDSSGNVYSGYRNRKNGNWEPVFQKHNSSGALQWEVTLAVSGTINGGYIDSNDDLYVQCQASNKLLIIKMNTSNGAIIWQNSIQAKSGAASTVTFKTNNSLNMQDDPADSTKIYMTCPVADSGSIINSNGSGFFLGIAKDNSIHGDVGTLIEYVASTETFTSFTSSTFNTSLGGGGTFTNTVGANYTGSDITTSTTKFDIVKMNDQ